MTEFADEIAALIVGADDDENYREAVRGAFARIGPEETVRQAEQAERLISALITGADDMANRVLYHALIRARELALEALEDAQACAAESGSLGQAWRLSRVNVALGETIDLLEEVSPEDFDNREDIYEVLKLVAQAGGIVAGAEQQSRG